MAVPAVAGLGQPASRPIASLQTSDRVVGWSRDSRAVYVQRGSEVPGSGGTRRPCDRRPHARPHARARGDRDAGQRGRGRLGRRGPRLRLQLHVGAVGAVRRHRRPAVSPGRGAVRDEQRNRLPRVRLERVQRELESERLAELVGRVRARRVPAARRTTPGRQPAARRPRRRNARCAARARVAKSAGGSQSLAYHSTEAQPRSASSDVGPVTTNAPAPAIDEAAHPGASGSGRRNVPGQNTIVVAVGATLGHAGTIEPAQRILGERQVVGAEPAHLVVARQAVLGVDQDVPGRRSRGRR